MDDNFGPEGICLTGDCHQHGHAEASLSDSQLEPMPACAPEVFGERIELISRYAELLASEGQLRGLVGPRELPRLWSRHLINCAAVLDFLPDTGTVADIGSGAGLPGIVIACARPELEVTLIESMEKRCQWLAEVCEALAIENVSVYHGRAEDLKGIEVFDAVTARAVGSIEKLMPWAGPLVASGGRLVMMKGDQAEAEVAAADKHYMFKRHKMSRARIHEVVSPADGAVTRIVECLKK